MTLTHPLAVVFVAIAVWWLSTGLVLAMVNRAGQGSRGLVLMAVMTVIGAGGFALDAVWSSGADTAWLLCRFLRRPSRLGLARGRRFSPAC